MLPVERDTDYVGTNVGATSSRQAAAEPDRSIINPQYPSSQAERTYFATIDAQASDVPSGGSGPLTGSASAAVTSPTVNTPAYPPSGSSGGSSVANYDPNNYPAVTSASSGLTATPTNYMPYIAAGAIALFALIALKLVRR